MGHSQRSGSPPLPFTQGLEGDPRVFVVTIIIDLIYEIIVFSTYLYGAITDHPGGCRLVPYVLIRSPITGSCSAGTAPVRL
jgi:hypothetical protein